MTKNLFPLGAAVALFMGFIVGCQDSVVDSTQSSDPFAAYVVDEVALTNFSELPTVDGALFSVTDPADSSDDDHDPADSSDGGHHGGRDTSDHRDSTDHRDTLRGGGDHHGDSAIRGGHDRHRGPGRDLGRGWGRLENRSYGRILSRLNLTDDQKTAIQACFVDFRACAEAGAEAYRAARQEKHDALETAIEAIKADVAAGTMTNDEARTAIRALMDTYRTEVGALNDTFKASLRSCQEALDACIVGHLTADQLVIWNRLHA
jgi:hypothetical protein